MFAAAICVSILLGVLVWALPGRLCDRRATHADVLAGPGIVLAVWIIAACVFAQPGLAQGFDLFRLLAINGAALWACGTVLLLRLRSGRRYRTLWTVAALLIAAIGLEVFVGNAPYFATHGYQPVDLRAYLQDAPADGEPIALNDEHSTLTFTGIHQPLYNVALDGVVYQYDGNYPQDQNPLFILWVSGTDEASTAPRQSWQWQAAPRAARSLVRTLDFSGAVDTLTLQAEGYSGEYRSYDLNYTVQAVLANVPRPMDFSLLRLAVVYLALLALWGLRPGAAAWHEAYLTHRAKYRPAVLVLGCMLCLLAAAAPFADARNSGVATSFYNVENWDGESRITFTQHISDWQNDSAAQYGALAHSLLNGRLDLQRDPPAAMAEMQNPYDTAARQSAAPDALWDVAYYQGRYYVYFGIVPCLLFQLPFELLTGVPDLPPSLAMIVMAWLLILAVFGLVRQAAQRWFPSASAAACLLAAAGIAGGSQVYYLLLRPSVYEYAILCGAAFVLLALWQWLCAANTPVQHHGKIMLHMALGSLCMALVAGCRPQMELFAVLCLPIFWPQYIRQKRLRSKQGITEAIAFVLPVILVALGLMAYNAARFGSPFDFGANYNLTSNDMTHRGFRIGRLAPALFTYFLSLPVVQAVFPYLAGTKMQTNYMGMTNTEVFYGGALAAVGLCGPAFAAPPYGKAERPARHGAAARAAGCYSGRVGLPDGRCALPLSQRLFNPAAVRRRIGLAVGRKRPCPACAGRRIGQHPAYRAAHAARGDAGGCCRGDLLQLLCLLCCGTGPSGPESRAVPECQPSGAVLAVKSGRKQNSAKFKLDKIKAYAPCQPGKSGQSGEHVLFIFIWAFCMDRFRME